MATLTELYQELDQLVNEFELSDLKEKILDSAIPSARLVLASEKDALMRSYIFGDPILPRDVRWPTNSEGWPLMQMAQIDLQDLCNIQLVKGLPRAGQLNFFYDWYHYFEGDDPRRYQVIYTPPECLKSLFKIEPHFPNTIMERKIQKASGSPYAISRDPEYIQTEVLSKPVFILIEQELTIPSYRSSQADLLLPPQQQHKDPRFNRYHDLYFKFCVKPPVIRMFGHSDPIQNCMQAELAKMYGGFLEDWILLFQLDSYSKPGVGWEWDNSGMLYFWIKQNDLAQRDFTKVRFITQCM